MDPRARITERGWGRDDPSNAGDVGDSDVVGDSDDVGDGIDAGDGGGQKGMQGGCQVGDSGTRATLLVTVPSTQTHHHCSL